MGDKGRSDVCLLFTIILRVSRACRWFYEFLSVFGAAESHASFWSTWLAKIYFLDFQFASEVFVVTCRQASVWKRRTTTTGRVTQATERSPLACFAQFARVRAPPRGRADTVLRPLFANDYKYYQRSSLFPFLSHPPMHVFGRRAMINLPLGDYIELW